MNAEMKSVRVPIYRKIEQEIRDEIRKGRWGAGAMLPSRQNLASQYSVSLGTVERAVTSLIADGVLLASDRRGTFVSSERERGAQSSGYEFDEDDLAGTKQGTGRAALGVVASYDLDTIDSTENLQYWIRQTAHAIAQAYLKPGEISVFYNTRVGGKTKSEAPLIDAVASLRSKGVSAIVLLDVHEDFPHEDLERLASAADFKNLPLVYVSASENDIELPHICFDAASPGRQAMSYSLSKGFDAFSFVSVVNNSLVKSRLNCVRAAADRAGLGDHAVRPFILKPSLDEYRLTGTAQRAAAYECGRQILMDDNFPRCIIAYNDYTAYGIMDAATELGLRSGDDYSILGFDDAPMSMLYGLTTFRPPLEKIGSEAARMLQRLQRGEPSSIQFRIRWQLVERSSSQRSVKLHLAGA